MASRDTLAAVDQLSSPMSNILISAAQEAFISGLNVVAGVCAAIAFFFAALAILLLRRVRPGSGS